MTHRVLMVGEITLDHVVVEDEGVSWQEPGGGALYSAIGALVWGARPVISAAVGTEFPETTLERIAAAGIDLEGVVRIDGPGLGVWLLYESGDVRRQVPRAGGSSFASIDESRPPWTELLTGNIEAVHVAPQTVHGQVVANEGVRERRLPATLDVMVEPFIEIERYRTGEALLGATALLPNEHELEQIWGRRDYRDLARDLERIGGVRYLVVKQGPDGAWLVAGSEFVHVPALSDRCVDTTGAGDAFCGGFLVGLLETDDPVEALVFGAVSASVVVESRGALPVLERVGEAGVAERAKAARQRLRRVA